MTRTSGRPLFALVLSAIASLVVTLAGCGAEADSDTAKLPAGAVPALHQKLPDPIKKSGVIRFAGDPHPPYRIAGADGKLTTGLDIDVQRALGRVLGVRTEIVTVSGLPASLGGMLARRHDVFNGPVQDTAEREKQFDAVVWMTTGTSYLVPARSGQTVKSAADLCGKRVAIVAGSVVENHMKGLDAHCRKLGRGALTPVGLADTNSTLLAVKAGRADAAGMTQNAALYAMRQEKNTYGIVTQTAEQGAGTAQLALLATKRDRLGPVILDAFRELFRTGEYQQIMKKWGMDQVMVPEPKMNVASGS